MSAASRPITIEPPSPAAGEALVGTWEWNFDADYFRVDASWCASFGLDPCTGHDHLERWAHEIHPDDVADFRRKLGELEAGRTDRFEAEYRILTGGSRWLWLLQRGGVVDRRNDGRPRRVVGICIEIDDRKRAEVLLRENESRLATALWGARAAFWQWQIATDVTLMSPLWFAMTGYSREEWESVPKPLYARLHEEDLPRVQQQVGQHLQGQSPSIEVEARVRTASGAYKWLLLRGRVVEWDFDGNPTSAIGVTLDIDEQKRAESELRTSEARLETAVWGSGMGLWEMDFLTESTRWFSDWCDRLNLHPCDGHDHVARWDSYIHPEDLPLAAERFSAHVAGQEDYYDAEYRIRDRAGHWRWLFERGRVVERDANGAALRMVGVCMDIDARKEAEIGARKSQRRLEAALESARGAMSDWDLETRAVTHTDYFFRMLGFELAEARSAPNFWLRQVHPEDAPRVLAAIGAVASGEREVYEHEYRLRHADGTWRWVFERGRPPVRGKDGERGSMVAFAIDVTDRKRLEREIVDISNREQQRIGGDLHDGLGQELTGIALMLRGVVGQLRKEGSAARLDVEDVIGLVNTAIEGTRALASGLSPVSAERGGLDAALRALAAKAADRYAIDVEYQSGFAQPPELDEESATHLYRITQEALTNVVRHARATRVTIALGPSDTGMELCIEDNGRGLPEPTEGVAGLGLKIMRYRAQVLGGTLVVERGPQGGTRVRCGLAPAGAA